MAFTVTAAAAGILTGSLATIYTVPTNRKFIVKALTFANHSGGALTLIAEATQNSGTQRRYIERTVDDNESDLAAELINQVLAAADVIQASGDGITFILSGILVNA
jgi:hypothetical protein